ncbi:MAG: ABC transporter permease [Promethearchaeota archaeon]
MITFEKIQFNLRQIFAIAEKEFKKTLRFKFKLIMEYINPLISMIFPLIIMGKFFAFQSNFGPWNQQTYLIYIFVGYNIISLQKIIGRIGANFIEEKYWFTLQALLIAPFNRLNLLLGLVLVHLIEMSIPFVIFLVILYIFFPINIITIMVVVLMFFALLIIFSGIGFLLGAFHISKESIAKAISTLLNLLFTFSCISFPYQIFPDWIQSFIFLNPIYYLIDIIRLIWLENNFIFTIISHPNHFYIFIIGLIILPIFGIYIFNKVFRRYGIIGY